MGEGFLEKAEGTGVNLEKQAEKAHSTVEEKFLALRKDVIWLQEMIQVKL